LDTPELVHLDKIEKTIRAKLDEHPHVTLTWVKEKGRTRGIDMMYLVAVYFALVVGIGMSGGIFVSGRLIDRFTKHSRIAYAVIPAISLALAVPFFVGFIWAPSWPLAVALLIGPTFLNYFYLSSAVALVQEEVAPNQRVLCGALLLLVMNMIGLGLGPTYVGAASDFFRPTHPEHSLQVAFYTLVPIYGLAIGLFLCLARVLRREVAVARAAR
ncbi:MAG: hypothetical protein ABI655_13625, partial [Phenylobacterium sp.]